MNSECNIHRQKFATFCPQCAKFMCLECECLHNKLIPIKLINKYLSAFSNHGEIATHNQMNAAQQELISLYNIEEVNLKSAFNKAVEYLSTYSNKKPEIENIKQSLIDAGVNEKGFRVINSFIEKKVEEICVLPTVYSMFLEKSKQIIRQLSTISNKFTELLEFQKPIPVATSTLLHFIDKNALTVIDTQTQCKNVIPFKINVNGCSESIACMGRIFIMGGSGPIADTYEVDIKASTLIIRSAMMCKKYNHSLCCNGTFIFSIGGCCYKAIDDCEKYDIINNKWTNLPNLLTARSLCAAFVMNNLYVYAFEGYTGTTCLNSLERLNVSNAIKWESVLVANVCIARCSSHAIQIKENTVLVFGGHGSNDSFTLQISEKNSLCAKNTNLCCTAEFCRSTTPIFDGKCVYGVDLDRKIHCYTLDTQTWSILK